MTSFSSSMVCTLEQAKGHAGRWAGGRAGGLVDEHMGRRAACGSPEPKRRVAYFFAKTCACQTPSFFLDPFVKKSCFPKSFCGTPCSWLFCVVWLEFRVVKSGPFRFPIMRSRVPCCAMSMLDYDHQASRAITLQIRCSTFVHASGEFFFFFATEVWHFVGVCFLSLGC